MPANLDVVNNDVVPAARERPLHADVFAREVRDTQLLPEHAHGGHVVQATAGRQLTQLFYQPVILPLQERLEAIDAASVPLFDPSKPPPPRPRAPPRRPRTRRAGDQRATPAPGRRMPASGPGSPW